MSEIRKYIQKCSFFHITENLLKSHQIVLKMILSNEIMQLLMCQPAF